VTLEQFLDRFDGPERSVVVVNRTDPDPVLNMLVDTFGDDVVRVVDGRASGVGDGHATAAGDDRMTDGAGPADADRSVGLTAEDLTGSVVVDRDDEVVPSLDVEVLRRRDDIPFDGGTPDDPDFSDSWFVVYRPPEGPHPAESDPESDLKRGTEGGVALLAVETESRVWRGLWTFEADRVSRVNRYIERNL